MNSQARGMGRWSLWLVPCTFAFVLSTVVMAVVVSAVLAKSTDEFPLNGCSALSATVTAKEQAMAEISDQALMRHQYQRSR